MTNEFRVNPLYFFSLTEYTWNCGLKHTNRKIETLQDKDMVVINENNFHGGIGSVMGDRDVKSDDTEKILYVDANNLYGWTMSQNLLYDENKFDV